MSIPVLTFFNNKGGVGKTTLIYNLAWMFALLRKRVVILDIDPQANLTSLFLDEDAIAEIWDSQEKGSTIYQCVRPLTGVGDLAEPILRRISTGFETDLHLLPGDVLLSSYEDVLSTEWPNSMGDANLYRPMRILSSFWQMAQMAGSKVGADIILIDVGPNLGAINRSVLVSTDYVVIPLGADLFSLQGLRNLGPALKSWKSLWKKRLDNWNDSHERHEYPEFRLPEGTMEPIGYLCQQYSVRMSRPVQAYDKWVNRIPATYRHAVLEEEPVPGMMPENDPYCLALIKHYRSLIPMAQERRKPIFTLTAADGAIGAHAGSVKDAGDDFAKLADFIAGKMGLPM